MLEMVAIMLISNAVASMAVNSLSSSECDFLRHGPGVLLCTLGFFDRLTLKTRF